MKPKKRAHSQIEKFERLARIVVETHLGSGRSRIEHLSDGMSNFVFDIKHPAGEVIVRISPHPSQLDVFIKEQWVQARAAEIGIPVAPILEVNSRIIDHPYMIVKAVEGTPAVQVQDRGRLLTELGEYAAAINSIKTNGYGESFNWTDNKLSFNKTFGDYLVNEFRYEERIEVLRRHRILPPDRLAKLRSMMRQMLAIRSRPTLNHGDLRLKNVLVDANNKIIALLDWEKAISNVAPQWELSIALHDLNIDEANCFLNGYGAKPAKLKAIAHEIKALNMLNYVQAIETAAAGSDRAALENIKLRFSGAFDLYSI